MSSALTVIALYSVSTMPKCARMTSQPMMTTEPVVSHIGCDPLARSHGGLDAVLHVRFQRDDVAADGDLGGEHAYVQALHLRRDDVCIVGHLQRSFTAAGALPPASARTFFWRQFSVRGWAKCNHDAACKECARAGRSAPRTATHDDTHLKSWDLDRAMLKGFQTTPCRGVGG